MRRNTLGKTSQELRSMTTAELPAVEAAFTEAQGQAQRYRDALARQRGAGTPRRGYAVIAVGLERLRGEEVA